MSDSDFAAIAEFENIARLVWLTMFLGGSIYGHVVRNRFRSSQAAAVWDAIVIGTFFLWLAAVGIVIDPLPRPAWEQAIVNLLGLIGIAAYCTSGAMMVAVLHRRKPGGSNKCNSC